MAIILYEGFNGTGSDSPKIDTTYWSTNNLTGITYGSGRTGNQLFIASYIYNFPPAVSARNNLTLSNFGNALATDDCIGLGCSFEPYSLQTMYFDGTNPTGFNPLYRNRFMEFRDTSNNVVLTLNWIYTTYAGNKSLALEIDQGGVVKGIYDARSYSGHTWTITTDGNSLADFAIITSRVYLEIFIDAKNQKRMSVRLSSDSGTIHGNLLNDSNQVYTTIDTFSSLGSITWFATHNANGTNMGLDDLYFTRGNLESECLLGANTRIYRLTVDSTGSPAQWISSNASTQHSNLSTADGDSNYIFSSVTNSGDTSIFGLSNLPVSPTGVSITVKPLNYVRKTSSDPTQNFRFTNVMTATTGGSIFTLGPQQIVDNNSYIVDSVMVSTNPATNAPWTVSDINNMMIGIRNLGPV